MEKYNFENYLAWCKKNAKKPQYAANLGQYLAEVTCGQA